MIRSFLTGEPYAFADCFDVYLLICEQLQNLLGRLIPIAMLADLASLFNAFVRSFRASEKRIIFDLATAKDGYGCEEINDIGWIPMTVKHC